MLINKIGGFYVDLDTICLRTFDFKEAYCFVSENEFGGMRNPKDPPIPPTTEPTKLINGCIFRAPAGCDFLGNIIARINSMDTLHAKWLDVGPSQFRHEVPNWGLEKYVKPPVTFDAVSPNELYHFISGGVKWDLSPDSYVIHLRSSAWKTGTGLDPDKEYPMDSLYEQLKKKHNVVSASVPGPQTDLESTVRPYTMVGSEKIRLIIDLAKSLDDSNIPGDFVEAGVCNGGSAAILAHFAATSRYNRHTHLFDSWQGLPVTTSEDIPSANGNTAESEIGKCIGDPEKVKEVLRLVGADMSRVTLYPGWFQDTFPKVDIKEIAFLSLDSDWFVSETLCWKKFYDRVAIGGFIYLDDAFYWPGALRACTEFFAKRTNEFPQIINRCGHAGWIKKQSQEDIVKEREKR
jgi:O-methyltransferase